MTKEEIIIIKLKKSRKKLSSVERFQGEWLMGYELYGGFGDSVLVITCSICKESFIFHGNTHNFCPNCGSFMRKGEFENANI